MFQNLNIRWAIIIAIVIGAIYFITPTYNYYSIVNDPLMSAHDLNHDLTLISHWAYVENGIQS